MNSVSLFSGVNECQTSSELVMSPDSLGGERKPFNGTTQIHHLRTLTRACTCVSEHCCRQCSVVMERRKNLEMMHLLTYMSHNAVKGPAANKEIKRKCLNLLSLDLTLCSAEDSSGFFCSLTTVCRTTVEIIHHYTDKGIQIIK